MNGTFNNKQTKGATPLQRTNAGYRVKKQYRKEKQNILSTKLYKRSINKYRLGSNQTNSRREAGRLAIVRQSI
jgi:hypothetical protein